MTALFALLASKLAVAGAAAKTGLAIAAVAATTATAGAVGALPGAVQDGFDRATGSDSAEVLEAEDEKDDVEVKDEDDAEVKGEDDLEDGADVKDESRTKKPAGEEAAAGGPKEGTFGATVSELARDETPGVVGQDIAKDARAKNGGANEEAAPAGQNQGQGAARSQQAREQDAAPQAEQGRGRGAEASEQGRARGGEQEDSDADAGAPAEGDDASSDSDGE